MKIAVMGTGYVGLVTGACLADLDNEVYCVDKEEEKVRMLSQGHIPIYEAGLEALVKKGLDSLRLKFTSDAPMAIRSSEIIFITVGTPTTEEGEADMSAVREVAEEIARNINGYKVIVNKSTVPVGSTKIVEKIIQKRVDGQFEFDVVSNPEFLREGTAVQDFLHPDRIVIGSDNQRAIGILTELYQPIHAPLVITDPSSAEMIKYASNAFLATKVSFINAIANICEAVGADVREVALGMGYDKRIGFEFLKSGPGFGGSCFPKDCRALIDIASKAGYHFHLLEGVMEVNQEQMKLMVEKARRRLGSLKGKKIAIWGLTFKANTDDLRESPALAIASMLREEGAELQVYDPIAMDKARDILKDVIYAADPYQAVEGVELLMLLTDWDDFKWLDFKKVRDLMAQPSIIDARNCLDPLTLRRMGFLYEGVGR